MTAPISAKAMALLGWFRLTHPSSGKNHQRWRHATGWEIHHCGHPTALRPWVLLAPDGRFIRTGVLHEGPCNDPKPCPYEPWEHGTAWVSLREAAYYVAGVDGVAPPTAKAVTP